MYAETARERELLIQGVRECRWNEDRCPIDLFASVKGGEGAVVHDFGNGCVFSVHKNIVCIGLTQYFYQTLPCSHFVRAEERVDNLVCKGDASPAFTTTKVSLFACLVGQMET